MYGQQMDMFQEGGVTLKDEGGEIEEVSGNEVPLGGVKEGVADDQPAQLSPGEMVLSEDVVRYHGVEKVMALRDEAKIGYHKMEAMGQLGNADEATIPTEAIFNPGGMPFSVVDLEYIDMDDDVDEAEAANGMYVQDMQTGGVVQSLIDPATGLPRAEAVPGVAPTSVSTPNVPTNIVNIPGESFPNFGPQIGNQPQIGTQPLMGTPIGIFKPDTSFGFRPDTFGDTTLRPVTPPPTPTVITPSTPITQQPTEQGKPPLPTANQFFGGAGGTNFFINELGQIIQIPVVNGRQIYETPEGFQPYDPQDPKPFDPDLEEKEEETPVDVPSTLQQPPPDVGFGPDRGALPDDGPQGSGFFSIDPSINAKGVIGAIISAATGLPITAFTGSPINLDGRTLSQAGVEAFTREGQKGYTGPTSFKNINEAVEKLTDPKNYNVTQTANPFDRMQFELDEQSDDDFDYATLEGVPARTGGTPEQQIQEQSGIGSAPDVSAEADIGSSGDPASAGGLGVIDPDTGSVAARAKGGLIEAQTGTLVPVQQPSATFSRINPETGLPETTAAPTTAVPQVLQPGTPAPITTGSALTPTTLSALTPTGTRVSAPDRPIGQQPPTTTPLPTGQQFLGGVQSTNFFINELGQVIQIPVVNGRQIYDEPKGFQPYDPSNPQPFDPDLEDDGTVTTPEQPQQRRRTITEREEGGQPDVGPGGFDTPEGLGLDEVGTIDSDTVDAVNNATTMTGLQAAAKAAGFKSLDTFMAHLDQRGYAELGMGKGIFSGSREAAENARNIDARHQFEQQQAAEDKTFARSFDPDVVEGFGPEDYDAPPASPFSGISDDTAAQWGGQEAGEAAGDTGSPGGPAGTGKGADSPDGSMLNKGGLVSKKRKPKKKAKKNNRKGLASKKKY